MNFRPRAPVAPVFKFEFPSAENELKIEKKERKDTVNYSELIGKEFIEPVVSTVTQKSVQNNQREIPLDEHVRKTVAGMLSNWEQHRNCFIEMHGLEKYEETYHMPPSFYDEYEYE